jgi:hypothetical protein
MNKKSSKKYFSRNAVKTNGRNNYNPMRGGIRL